MKFGFPLGYTVYPNMIATPHVASLDPGEELHFRCRPGYVLPGSGSAECMSSGRIAFPGIMQFCDISDNSVLETQFKDS